MKGLGGLLLTLGLGGVAYFMLAFDTSVAVPKVDNLPPGFSMPERVNNLGLMADKSNGLNASALVALIGTALLIAGSLQAKNSKPKPPIGFNYPLADACKYIPSEPLEELLARQEWERQVKRHYKITAYNPAQLDWAYESGVSPSAVGLFLDYIEAHKAWERANEKPESFKLSAS